MSGLDRLERAKGGPFTYRLHGQVRGLPSPVDLPPFAVLEILEHGFPHTWVSDMAPWRSDLLAGAWSAHFDLPPHRSAQRLLYLLDRYHDELEFDLRVTAQVDPGELYRAREWRRLLNFIDRLPSHSYYTEAVSNDEEHAEMIAKAEAERAAGGDPAPKWAPPLRTWTPEVDALHKILDSVNGLKYITMAVNSEKGKTPPPPEPSPRPTTAIERARQRATYHKRLEQHNSLAARMLPHKYSAPGVPKKPAIVEPPTPKPVSPGTAFLRKKAGLAD